MTAKQPAAPKKELSLNELLKPSPVLRPGHNSQQLPDNMVTTSKKYKPDYHPRLVKLQDTDDFLQQKAFEARYKFNTAEKEGSKTAGLFNSLVKFFVTEKVEIKTEANLPIFLLNRKYPERPIFKGADLKKQIEEISLKF